MKKKKAVVLHSGGIDSSTCLWIAKQDFEVTSISFAYQQKHLSEIEAAYNICQEWGISRVVFHLDLLPHITSNALTNPQQAIIYSEGSANTMVVGRNGLMAHLAGIYAHSIGASHLFLGVTEIEGVHNGYRDCSRNYFNIKEQILRIDLANPNFQIHTPVIHLNKKEILYLAHELKILSYLLEHTISCYQGISHLGCQKCPACHSRNNGLKEFLKETPSFYFPEDSPYRKLYQTQR